MTNNGRAEPHWILRLDGGAPPDRALIGGKAQSIADMLRMGLPVPPAFVVTTQACTAFMVQGAAPPGLWDEVSESVGWLEQKTGRSFASGPSRLLLSVRSGAPISMPGMMDTVLNLGIDLDGEAALAAETGSADFARDTHRRFCALYADIVMKAECGALDPAAGPQTWRAAIERAAGAPMLIDPRDQLKAAILAVFDSWNSRRAKRYRAHHGIADDLGTAVTVQAMVFGNLDDSSGTGVLFSRNPLTGNPTPFGEYLPRAQGEDVVSGRFTPLSLQAMRSRVPAAHDALLAAGRLLEKHHADIQDIEFTVQRGALFLLQARAAKRSAEAAARLAVDMVDEGLIDEDTALSRITAEQIVTLLRPKLTVAAKSGATIIAHGEGACPGAATGIAVGDPDEAERRASQGEDIILVRATTSPDDIHGMIAARGIVTAQGGATSHAAVVSRALGRPCVVGAGSDPFARLGEVLTVDGEGVVYAGALAVEAPDEASNPILARLIDWAQRRCPIQILSSLACRGPVGAPEIDEELALDPTRLAQVLRTVTEVGGAALARPSVATAAAKAGVRVIITNPVLPALLSVIASGGA